MLGRHPHHNSPPSRCTSNDIRLAGATRCGPTSGTGVAASVSMTIATLDGRGQGQQQAHRQPYDLAGGASDQKQAPSQRRHIEPGLGVCSGSLDHGDRISTSGVSSAGGAGGLRAAAVAVTERRRKDCRASNRAGPVGFIHGIWVRHRVCGARHSIPCVPRPADDRERIAAAATCAHEPQLTKRHVATSAATMRANQLRLSIRFAAQRRPRPYVLLCALRRMGLAHTQFATATATATATCNTIGLKLLKIGGVVRISVRRISIAMTSVCHGRTSLHWLTSGSDERAPDPYEPDIARRNIPQQRNPHRRHRQSSPFCRSSTGPRRPGASRTTMPTHHGCPSVAL